MLSSVPSQGTIKTLQMSRVWKNLSRTSHPITYLLLCNKLPHN